MKVNCLGADNPKELKRELNAQVEPIDRDISLA